MLVDTADESKIAAHFRAEAIRHSLSLEKNHIKSCFPIEEYDIRLIEILGFVQFMPVAYAGFEACGDGCDVLIWRFLYVPENVRNKNITLPFIRTLKGILKRQFGSEKIIEMTYHKDNKVMERIASHFGFDRTYIKAVKKLG